MIKTLDQNALTLTGCVGLLIKFLGRFNFHQGPRLLLLSCSRLLQPVPSANIDRSATPRQIAPPPISIAPPLHAESLLRQYRSNLPWPRGDVT